MREEILKRKQAEEFSSSEGNKDIVSENTSNDENLPIVNINPNSIDSKVDKIDYKNNPNKDIANSQVASNPNENNPNSISKDLIEKELNRLIRNSTFAFVRSPWTTTRRRDKKTKRERGKKRTTVIGSGEIHSFVLSLSLCLSF